MNYNEEMMKRFDDWLNDNSDEIGIYDRIHTPATALRNADAKLYEVMLKDFIKKHNMFAEYGNIRDENGRLLDPQPKEIF